MEEQEGWKEDRKWSRTVTAGKTRVEGGIWDLAVKEGGFGGSMGDLAPTLCHPFGLNNLIQIKKNPTKKGVLRGT